jgi:hypothetical protein
MMCEDRVDDSRITDDLVLVSLKSGVLCYLTTCIKRGSNNNEARNRDTCCEKDFLLQSISGIGIFGSFWFIWLF